MQSVIIDCNQVVEGFEGTVFPLAKCFIGGIIPEDAASFKFLQRTEELLR